MMTEMADIDEVMYACGLEVLHPGGIEKSDEMARRCGIGPGKRVLDVGAGKGVTACHLARAHDCEVVGVDAAERMVADARETARRRGLADRVSFQVADAHQMPFEDASFDIVLSECTTTLLNKERVFSEFLRVVRSGGYVGDLEMIWREPAPPETAAMLEDAWDGFTTMTPAEWEDFFRRAGLGEVEAVDFSEEYDLEKAMTKELGVGGMLKVAWRLILRSDLRKAMKEYREVMREAGDYLGYAYIVGRKP